MLTMDGLLPVGPSVTTSWKVRVAALAGAVNVGLTAVALDRVTCVPPVWVHWYVSGFPSESLLPEPSSCTDAFT